MQSVRVESWCGCNNKNLQVHFIDQKFHKVRIGLTACYCIWMALKHVCLLFTNCTGVSFPELEGAIISDVAVQYTRVFVPRDLNDQCEITH